jgi:hypothetical protein
LRETADDNWTMASGSVLERTLFPTLFVLLLSGTGASAQSIPQPPDTSEVRVQLGPVLVDPKLALTNAGIDTNVFNEPTDADPKDDFTMTLTPAADLWLRMGRTWLTGNLREDVVWFQKYSSERSSNFTYGVGWSVPLTRVGFAVTANWLNTRERPGYEIDTRADRREDAYTGIFELRAFPRTVLGVRATHQDIDFADDEVFLGRSLSHQLNRTTNSAVVTIRREVTPLTRVAFEAGRTQERYESSDRDADSTELNLLVLFDPAALLNGSARIGFRKYSPLSTDLPEFNGLTSAVDVTYIAAGATKLTAGVVRNVEQSFELTQPYYILTGITAEVAQQIYGPVDAVARIGAQRMAYRERVSLQVEEASRVDHVRSFGGGIGYHVGDDLRVGFNVDRQKRTSIVDLREYEGLRFGATITYGQ